MKQRAPALSETELKAIKDGTTVMRAYSILNIKAVEDEKRIIRGMATTPEVDRMGDVVEPLGVQFKNPVALLWMHDDMLPVGSVVFGKPTKDGVPFTASIPLLDDGAPQGLKDRIAEAWSSVKAGLIRAVSIGFRALEYSFIEETGGLRFIQTELLELSLVSVPANSGATITDIKSIDTAARAALGNKRAAASKEDPAGASANTLSITVVNKTSAKVEVKTTQTVKLKPKEGSKMKIDEQIKQFQAERAAKAAEMLAIMKKAEETGETLNQEQADKYDELEKEVEQVDKHLKRLNGLKKLQGETATPVDGSGEAAAAASRSGHGPTIIVSKNATEKFKGQNFTRMTIAKALARLHETTASAIAEARWGKTNPQLVEVIKANEVPGGGSGGGEWGAQLVLANNQYIGDFIEFLNSKTIYDKLPLREVPANITIKGQGSNASAYWVGQGKAIPATKVDFTNVTLTPLKVAAIASVSNELLRDSSPAAEALVRDALAEASAQKIDGTLLGNAAAVAGVSPAGLLNGLGGIASAGTDGLSVRQDVAALYAPFITAKNASGLYFVMNTSLAKTLSLMVNALGQSEFPLITAQGGTLLGDPVVTGDNVTADQLILLKPSDIYEIGDLGVEVQISRDAMIEQNSAPTGDGETPASASQDMVSMFQNEMTAIKIVRPINFAKRRASAVAFITGADYAMVPSS